MEKVESSKQEIKKFKYGTKEYRRAYYLKRKKEGHYIEYHINRKKMLKKRFQDVKTGKYIIKKNVVLTPEAIIAKKKKYDKYNSDNYYKVKKRTLTMEVESNSNTKQVYGKINNFIVDKPKSVIKLKLDNGGNEHIVELLALLNRNPNIKIKELIIKLS